MQTTEKQSLCSKFNVAALYGLLVLAALALPVQAAEPTRTRTGAEENGGGCRTVVLRGVSRSLPLRPGWRIQGDVNLPDGSRRLFLETHEEDTTSDSGYIYQGISLRDTTP